MMRKTCFSQKFKLSAVALAVAVSFVNLSARAAYAQCDPAFFVSIPAAALVSYKAQDAHRFAIEELVKLESRVLLHEPVLKAMDEFDEEFKKKLNHFWNDLWIQGLKDMTKQMVATMVDQNMDIGKILDHQSMQAHRRALERAEIEAVKQYAPDSDSCIFDSVGTYKLRAALTARDTSNAMSNQNISILNNQKGTIGATSSAARQTAVWDTYVKHFCDPEANNKNSGCTTPGTAMGKHVSPGRALFANPTLPEDEGSRLAVETLMQYITGYEILNPMGEDTLNDITGIQRRQKNRAYMAQMDSASALISSIVGERSPSIAAPEVQQIRTAVKIQNPSVKPSEYEIRQASLEQLWMPQFYERLNEGGPVAARQEIYLQAYNLQALYRLIEKFEKISVAYAIQGGNILDAHDKSRVGGQEYNTFRCGAGGC
jgi:hypothetical protein